LSNPGLSLYQTYSSLARSVELQKKDVVPAWLCLNSCLLSWCLCIRAQLDGHNSCRRCGVKQHALYYLEGAAGSFHSALDFVHFFEQSHTVCCCSRIGIELLQLLVHTLLER